MKLNLTFVKRAERESKAGKPFTSISIKATQYGDKYLSGFADKSNESWKIGDEVEVVGVTSKESNGKTYLNFEMPKRAPNVEGMALMTEIKSMQVQNARMLDYLLKITNHLSGKERLDMTSAGTKVPDFSQVEYGLDQINPDEIPF